MIISKKNMAARANKAALMAPSIDDRLRQARALVSSHPVDESSAPIAAPVTPPVVDDAAPPAAEVKTLSSAYLAMVSVDLIDQSPVNARKIYRPERVNELASSIGANGQEVPGIATIRNGRYVLAAGHYRLRALKLLSVKTMALMIHDGMSDRALYGVSYRENSEREAQSSMDNALAWRELLDTGIYASETEIAEVTGMSLPNVNKTLAALRLAPAILDIVKENPGAFALSSLYELVLYEKAAGEARAISMAKQICAGEASRRDIQEARAQAETSRERKRKETSRQYKIQGADGVQIGILKDWDSGKVALEISLPNPIERDALVAELRTRFGLTT